MQGIREPVEGSNGHSGTESMKVQCEVLRDIGQTFVESSRYRDTEPRDGTLSRTDRPW